MERVSALESAADSPEVAVADFIGVPTATEAGEAQAGVVCIGAHAGIKHLQAGTRHALVTHRADVSAAARCMQEISNNPDRDQLAFAGAVRIVA